MSLQSNSILIKNNFYRLSNGKHDPHAPFTDKFASFKWRGEKSWEDYGCFIINSGNELKWPGQTTQSSYSAPLFGSNSQTLTSTTFNAETIKLKLGLYGITAKEYKKFFVWMDPLVIDKFYYGYDNDYYYMLKLESISEATKNIIGHNKMDEIYYAEVNVSFKIQGELCGWSDNIILWHNTSNENENPNHIWYRKSFNFQNLFDNNISLTDSSWISDIRNSLKIHCQLPTIINNSWLSNISIFIAPITWEENQEIVWDSNSQLLLLDLQLKTSEKLITENTIPQWFSFVYDSSDGLLYQTEDKQLITLSSKDIVKGIIINKILLPSKLEDANFYNNINGNRIRDIGIKILINNELYTENVLTPDESLENNINSNNYPYIEIYSVLKTPII